MAESELEIKQLLRNTIIEPTAALITIALAGTDATSDAPVY